MAMDTTPRGPKRKEISPLTLEFETVIKEHEDQDPAEKEETMEDLLLAEDLAAQLDHMNLEQTPPAPTEPVEPNQEETAEETENGGWEWRASSWQWWNFDAELGIWKYYEWHQGRWWLRTELSDQA